jgi:hypothetical protein
MVSSQNCHMSGMYLVYIIFGTMIYTRYIPDIPDIWHTMSYDRYISGIYQIYVIHRHMSGIYLAYTHIITFLQVPDATPLRFKHCPGQAESFPPVWHSRRFPTLPNQTWTTFATKSSAKWATRIKGSTDTAFLSAHLAELSCNFWEKCQVNPVSRVCMGHNQQ